MIPSGTAMIVLAPGALVQGEHIEIGGRWLLFLCWRASAAARTQGG